MASRVIGSEISQSRSTFTSIRRRVQLIPIGSMQLPPPDFIDS
jgi:hypothetical protein